MIRHIRSTLNALQLLCTVGLIQFGEKTNKDTELVNIIKICIEKILVYHNNYFFCLDLCLLE